MSEFNEEIFIFALTSRPEDAKRFAHFFKPQWLRKSEYQPLLAEIYKFVKKNGEPPSLVTLHKIMEKQDINSYNIRYKETIERLQKENPDRSEIIFVLDQAKGVAITRSFLEMAKDPAFTKKQLDFDGTSIIKDVQSWLVQFSNTGEDRTMDIKQAIETLVQSAEFTPTNERIATHIAPLDDWTGGGLRKKQLSIIIAPTGHGKSALLLIIGHKIATIEEKNIWLITNELPLEEVTERELSKLTGIEVGKIMDDPTIAYKGLDFHWKKNLDKRFTITEYNREVSIDDIESDLSKMVNLYGWKPDVIILDYIERMKPSTSGYKRDNEWGWLGAVAKDLSRLAKRHNLLIWTAAQTNRAGLSATELDSTMAQASIRHLQEATAVIGMRQEDIPGTDKVAIKLKPLKMRQSKRSSRSVTLECDLSRMNISNEVVEIEPEEENNEDDVLTKYTPREKQKFRRRK